MLKRYTTITTSLALAGLMSFAVQANDTSTNTQEWAKEAGTAISNEMKFPTFALRQGRSGSASFVVTVNRDGDVVDYYSTGGKSASSFRSSAKQSLNRVDFPALPASIRGHQVSFTLNMEYQQGGAELNSNHYSNSNKGTVSGTQIALLPTVSLSTGR